MQISKLKDVSKVAARAYEIWEDEGRPEGRDRDHWLRAEAELATDVAAKAKPVKKASAKKPAAKKTAAKPAAKTKTAAAKARVAKKAG